MTISEFLALVLLVGAIAGFVGAPARRASLWPLLPTLMLSLAAVRTSGVIQAIILIVLLLMTALRVLRSTAIERQLRAWAIGSYVAGVIGFSIFIAADGEVATLGAVVGCAVLLPLFPLHGGYLAAVAGLPPAAAAFTGIALPILGLKTAAVLMPVLPEDWLPVIAVFAVFGTVYGSFRALVQKSVVRLLAYGGFALITVIWWHLASLHAATVAAFSYLGALTLVIAGLRLAWQAVEHRYGNVAIGQLPGLARTMPRFAFLFGLLVTAAMGLPPFGVFTGYVHMLLAPTPIVSAALFLVLFGWFAASWYWITMLQGVLFGRHRTDVPYDDVRWTEAAAAIVIVVALLAIGALPEASL